MKAFIQVALAATLVVGTTAQPHAHQHRHQHAEKRDAVTVTSVVAATVTEYVLDGEKVDIQLAQDGIKGGNYIVVGSSTPTFTPPPSAPPASSSSPAPSSSSVQAAQFFEIKESSSSSSTPVAASTSAAAPTSVASAKPSSSATGIDVPFPTGDDAPDCNVFPSAYGAIPVDWLGTKGWTSLQQPSNGYTPGVEIATIVAPTQGGCTEGTFCSYACPAGYEKSQWPEDSQGATGQSVGGLWCDTNGKLQLTRPDHPYICEKGAGGVVIKNSLSSSAAVCRTDYPASESMVIPLETTPGGTFDLTNPDSSTYYMWDGKATTAQYYVNNQGVSVEDACVWTSPTYPAAAGNWAPINIGVGMDTTGTTYLSIFPNKPTSDAVLDFNIKIHGDVSIECKLENGVFSNGDSGGCTVSLLPIRPFKPLFRRVVQWLTLVQTAISSPGGTATIEFY